MPENTLETKARRAIAQYNMLPPGALVLAALSGGADSVALTHFLCREGAGKFTLLVAHVNHGLRGGESDRDEEFAREFCAKSGLELFVKRVNVRREMQNGESEEVCGRRIRYAFFQEVLEQAWEPDQARELGQARRPPPARCIATAHTQNDSAETVLLNLVRGSGGAGLRGIPAVRGKNSELADEYENSQLSTVNLNSAEFIIRPLIHVSREDVVDYCVRHGISYVTDSSNHSDKYARNRVRTLVIPGLVTVNPAAVQTITRTAEFIARDEEYLSAQSAGEAEKIRRRHPFLGETYPVAGLLALPSPIRRRVLVAAALGASGHLPEAVHIKCMERLLENGGQTSLPGGFFAALSTGKERGKLYFFKKERFDLQNRKIFGMIEDKGTANAKLTQNAPNVHKNFLIAMLDSDRIVGEHHIRSSLPGDTLQLHKRPVKLLRKIWSELGVPPHLRANAAVIADEGGVLAAEFAGVAQRAAVSTDTKRVLQIWESGSAGFCSQRTK